MKKILKCCFSLTCLCAGAFSLIANPAGEAVKAGNAAITRNGPGSLTVNQSSDKVIINWNSFSIGAGEVTRFVQPNANAAALNRVLGGSPSAIYGRLEANGSVYVINPAGVMVGPSGLINTRSFVGSTLDISDAGFLSGVSMRFAGSSTASVRNEGTINALGGDIFLFAHTVDNAGNVNAPVGTVGLGAGSEILLRQSGTERLSILAGNVSAPKTATGVNNAGAVQAASAELKAAGGNMYALAINNGGIVRADTIVHEGGRILLKASGGNIQNSGTLAANGSAGKGGSITIDGGHNATAPATVTSSGTIDASGASGKGGDVKILGDHVGLLGSATVNVSGNTGGGTALIGGDYQGNNPSIQNAARTYISPDAHISADAFSLGNGGRVIVWANDLTRFFGSLSARGANGSGGFAEISGKGELSFAGQVDLGSFFGNMGRLLLDPKNIIIAAANPGGGAVSRSAATDVDQFSDNPTESSWLTGAALVTLLNAANVTLQANNDISFREAVTATSGGNNLTLRAGRSIDFQSGADLTLNGNGVFTATFNDGGATAANRDPGAATFNMAAGTTITARGGISIQAGTLAANSSGAATVAANTGNILINNLVTAGPTVAADSPGVDGGNISVLNNAGAATGKNIVAAGSLDTRGSSAANNGGGTANHNAGSGGTVTVDASGTVATDIINTGGGDGVGTGNGGSAGTITLTGDQGITLNNNISALGGAGAPVGTAGNIVLAATAGGVNQTAGALAAGGLSLSGAGTFTLNQSGNDIATLAADVTGNLSYRDANALTLGTAGNGILSAGGNIDIQTANGSITGVDALPGLVDIDADGGSVSLSAGGDNSAISLDASIQGLAGVTLTADRFDIVTATRIVDASGATILIKPSSAGRVITVGTDDVSGSTATTGTLGLSATEIAQLRAAAGGTLKIGDAASGNLSVTAPLTVVSATAGTLSLQSGAAINQAALAIVTVPNLALRAGTTVALTEANAVNTIAGTAAGNFSFNNNNALAVGAADAASGITAGSANLTTTDDALTVNNAVQTSVGDLTINTGTGLLTLAQNLAAGANNILLTSGGVTQTGGTVTGAGLRINSSGAVTLNGDNDVDTLAALLTGAGNAFSFRDLDSLVIGTVAPVAGITANNGNIVVTTVNGPLTVSANADAGGVSGTVTLTAGSLAASDNTLTVDPGAVVRGLSGVSLIADNLAIDASGLPATINAGSSVATIRQTQNGTTINLGGADGANTLGITDAEFDRITAGTIKVGDANSGAISVSSIVSPVSATTLSLQSGAGISEIAGAAIVAPNLALRAGGPVALNQNNNVNNVAASVSGAANSFVFRNDPVAAGLTVGAVDGVTGITTANGNVTLAADSLNIANSIAAAGARVKLQPSSAGLFNIDLGTETVGKLSLTDAELDRITASVLEIDPAGAIDVSAAITLAPASVPTLSLVNDGSIGGAGSISAQNLRITSTGPVTLNGDVDTLAASYAGVFTPFQFTDSDGLTIGTVDSVAGITSAGGDVILSTGGQLVIGTGLGQDINVAGAASIVTLNVASGGATEAAGSSIIAPVLTLRGNGDFLLDDAGNDLIVIAGLVNGTVNFTDANTVQTGSGSDSIGFLNGLSAGNNPITLTADGIDLPSLLSSGTARLTLQPLTAGRLIDLGTKTAGKLALDASDLANVTAGTLQIGRANAGAIDITAAVAPTATTLALVNNGAIGGIGALAVPNLRISSPGPVTLNGANDVNNLAATVTTAGNTFAFSDTDDLTVTTVDGVTGITTVNGPITLASGNTLTLTDPVDAGAAGTITLNNNGLATVAGTLTAGTLNLLGAGNVGSLANRINTTVNTIVLGKFGGNTFVNESGAVNLQGTSAGGNLDVVANGAITLAGVLNLGAGSATLDSTTISLAGFDLTGGTVTLNHSGLANSGAGRVNATTLALNGNGDVGSSGTRFNTTVGRIVLTKSAGNTFLNEADAVNVDGLAPTLDLVAGGPISQVAGLNISGAALFKTLNNLGAAINLNRAGDTVNNSFGSVNAQVRNAADTANAVATITIHENDAGTVLAGVQTGGALDVVSAGPITQTAALTAGSLAAFKTLNNGGAAINLNRAGDTVNNSFGSVNAQVRNATDTANASAAVTIHENDASTVLAGVQTGGALDVVSSGPIIQTAGLTVGGAATFKTVNNVGAAIALDRVADTVNNSFGSVSAQVRNATDSANATALVTIHENDAATVLAGVQTGGAVEVTAAGPVTQTAALDVGGLTTINVNSATDVTLNSPANNFASVTVPLGNNISLGDQNGFTLGAVNAGGTFSLSTSAGSVVQLLDGSFIVAQTLSASLGGGLILGNPANSSPAAQPANRFATLGAISHTGDLYLFDSDSVAYPAGANPSPLPTGSDRLGLTINGPVSSVSGGGKTIIRTMGDLVLAGPRLGTVVSRATGDIELSAENNGNFHNLLGQGDPLGADGSLALNPGSGRFLVFSTDGALNFGSAVVDNKFTFNKLAADFLADFPAQSFNNTPPIIKQDGQEAGPTENGFVFLVQQDFVQVSDETAKFFLDVLNLVVFTGVNATAKADSLPPERPPTIWTSSYHIYLQQQQEKESEEKKSKNPTVAQLAPFAETRLAGE